MFKELEVDATFLFTGQAVKHHPNVAVACVENGHEVGCHSYEHETVGDPLFDLPGERRLLPHEVKPRIELNTELVENATGIRPVSFRCPRLWGSTEVVKALDDLGYMADLTYPMYYYRQQFEPFFPSLSDWTVPGNSRVLEIPNFADMTMISKDPGLERDRDQWPKFRTHGGEFMVQKSLEFSTFCANRGLDTYLCFYVHPWEFWPMEKEYNFGEATVTPENFITKNCGPVALDELRKLIVGLLEAGANFMLARDVPELVRSRQVDTVES